MSTAAAGPAGWYGQAYRLVADTVRAHTLTWAEQALAEPPVTVTAQRSARSAGGPHDFFSEADYWWPDPDSAGGLDRPYIRRDGLTNPANFTAHRHAMVRLSRLVGGLAAAYRLTGDDRYVRAAQPHVHAWFVDPATAMNPNLTYAQAIHGLATGRGIGIIDTIHLMEVTQGLLAMQDSPALDPATLAGTCRWFGDYLHWLNTHEYERDAANNHGTCWVLQVAAFAAFVGDAEVLRCCRRRFTEVLLPAQMAADGSFPLELARTKPYGYSIFNADALATACQLLSEPGHDLWALEAAGGPDLALAFEFLQPFLADKTRWPYPHDVAHYDEWPVASPGLLFAAIAYQRRDWLQTWQQAPHWPDGEEVLRNLPVRNPLLWLAEPG